MDLKGLRVRTIALGDPLVMSVAFAAIGRGKPVDQFKRYLREQTEERRKVLVAFIRRDFAGYVTINWTPDYAPLAAAGIPELQDLNVLPPFRRRGLASHLLDHAEELVRARSDEVGIAVGLHPGYNAAQRLYGKRGYIADGNGVSARDGFVREGQTVVMDDDLVLHLVKRVNAPGASSSSTMPPADSEARRV